MRKWGVLFNLHRKIINVLNEIPKIYLYVPMHQNIKTNKGWKWENVVDLSFSTERVSNVTSIINCHHEIELQIIHNKFNIIIFCQYIFIHSEIKIRKKIIFPVIYYTNAPKH